MSKLRVDQVETLDGLNTKNVATLIDDINNAGVATSTGEQTLAEALDARVIFKSTKSGLDAIPASDLSDGQEAQVLGTPFVWDAAAGEWIAQGPINASMYGLVGDGITDNKAAFKTAVESLRDGETLWFEPGHYTMTYGDITSLADWARIQASGATLTCAPGTVKIDNALILVEGSFEAPMDIGAAGFTSGDNTITTASAHGLSVGDFVQVLSQRNSYTPDGLDYQLGSQNPTTLETPRARFAEFHEAANIVSSTEFNTRSLIIYPEYEDNTASLSEPMTDVTSAQIRKMNPVSNVSIENIAFRNFGNNGFRCIYAFAAYALTLDHLVFEGDDATGVFFRTESCWKTRIKGAESKREPLGASGSGWNSFKIGGGSQDTLFDERCSLAYEAQAIDFTPATESDFVLSTLDEINSEYLTVQLCFVQNSLFENCLDGTTTHPGTFIFMFQNNTANQCRVGVRCRSRASQVTGNKLITSRVGCVLAAFYENSLVSGNRFEEKSSPLHVGNWKGVEVTPMSSEIMNPNDFQNVHITGNYFDAEAGSLSTGETASFGVEFSHVGNGTPPNGGFTKFTNSIKAGLSGYTIQDNSFSRCGIRVRQFINGVNVLSNSFREGGDLDYFFLSESDSVRHRIGLNMFSSSPAPANHIVVGMEVAVSYTYSTTHKIGQNIYAPGNPSNSLVNYTLFGTES